jgi:outer membrane receptor protein involved in Fe transport
MTAFLLMLAGALFQSSATLSGVVKDPTGAPMQAVVVIVTAGPARATATTSADGTWSVTLPADTSSATISIDVQGFAAERRAVTPSAAPVEIVLRAAAIAEQVSVSAEAGTTRLSVQSSVTSIDRSTIVETPALRLDDQLRTVPGFSLFRRTTSAVANPTTQGVTLRGMSASGASRTLVIADDVPLNDAFGAWVYWDRVPMAALQRIDVVRGASGDVHGNDALGGVIQLTTRTNQGGEAWLEGGNLGTVRGSFYGAVSRKSWMAGGAAESGKTDGFVVVAPEARGPIDVKANSQATSAMGWVGGGSTVQATARGGYFDEDRNNGTPLQVNATITRWGSASAHGFMLGGVWEARGDFSANNYNQSFTAVTTVNGVARAGERLTSLQWVGSDAGGGAFDWIRQGSRGQGLVSFSERAAHANLDEQAFSTSGVGAAVVHTPATQHDTGLVAHGEFALTPHLTLSAGARGEWWTLTNPGGLGTVQDRFFFQPRVAATFAAADGQTLRVSWLSGFRTPTINELFRSFRVGSTLTQANSALKPERSSGPEAAYTITRHDWTARAIFYATWLDDAIYNRTITATPTAITRQRDNASARAIGSELEFEWRLNQVLSATTSWAFTDSTFTQAELDGNRVPQVPTSAGSVGLRATHKAWSASFGIRVFGEQFDDDQNQFTLRAGSLTDARAALRLSRHGELFGAIENAFDQEIDTGKTPIRTIGAPRQARAGLIVRF